MPLIPFRVRAKQVHFKTILISYKINNYQKTVNYMYGHADRQIKQGFVVAYKAIPPDEITRLEQPKEPIGLFGKPVQSRFRGNYLDRQNQL